MQAGRVAAVKKHYSGVCGRLIFMPRRNRRIGDQATKRPSDLAMPEKTLAALIASVCLVLLVRLFMPERHRWRLDAAARRGWQVSRDWALRVWRWRSSRKKAARIAEEAIRRARDGVEREGNVYRPRSFREPRDSRDSREPRKPH